MTHPELVAALCKPGEDILATLTPDNAHLIHMLLGLQGEVGELVDAFKKGIIYGQPFDFENIYEELGDIEFFLEGIRQTYTMSREYAIVCNIKKLQKRYGDKYSNSAAKERKDKQ